MAGSNFSPRKAGMLIDVVHIVLGIAIVIMAGFAIFDPEGNKALFPAIFLLASVINFVTAWFIFRMFPRVRKKQLGGIIYLITGMVILIVFVISAISIWGNP